MRRKDREVTDPAKIREIIAACTCCRLGLCDEGRAYIVPLNFGFEEGDGRYTFYFHSAMEGRKISLIHKNGWASFEMDAGHEIMEGSNSSHCSARFQCVMGGGKVTLLEDREKKKAGLAALMLHDTGRDGWEFEDAMVDKTAIIRLDVEELTCKVRA